MVSSRSVRLGLSLAIPMMAFVLVAREAVVRAEDTPGTGDAGVRRPMALRLPVCGANEALATRLDGEYVCKPLPAVPPTLGADCSLGSATDDTSVACIPRGTGQTDPFYATRRDSLTKWLDSGTTARMPSATPPFRGRSYECGSFTKVSPDLYRCETAPSKEGAPLLPTLKCTAGQTVTFTAQHEVKCLDLPAGRVALPCMDFGSGQTSHDGTSIECGPRNSGAVDEPALARTLEYLYRMIENQPPRELARPVKPSLRTGRIPMCGEGQTLVWREGSLFCATQGAAAITRTDASVLKLLIERVIVKLQRIEPLVDPFLPGAKLGDTPAVVFLDKR